MGFDPYDVVLGQFPFLDEPRSKPRPLVVVSERSFNDANQVAVVLMVTTAARGRWATDHEILDLTSAGLMKPCVIRMKIMTLSVTLLRRRIGVMALADRDAIGRLLSSVLPLQRVEPT